MQIASILILTITLLLFSPAYSCPQGWKFMASSGTQAEFCIEEKNVENVRAYEAHLICEEKAAKLCTTEQWVLACKSGAIHAQGWEWALSLGKFTSIIGNNSCDNLGFGELSPFAGSRCCL